MIYTLATLRGAFDYQKNTRDNYYPTNTTRKRAYKTIHAWI